MTSEMLKVVVSVLAVLLLIAHFFLDRAQDKEKKQEADNLRATLQRMEEGIKILVAEGKITKDEAQRIFLIKLEDSVQFGESLKTEVQREESRKKNQVND